MKHVDILIIGAGLSGIGAYVYFKKEFPNKTIKIIEKRKSLGGTWDVFRYPGVRSDSDMYTLGYSFKPWTKGFFASGQEILDYINETAIENNVEIDFDTVGTVLEWSNDRWILNTNKESYTANFVLSTTGYINHSKAHVPKFKDSELFEGTIVHTQFWKDIDYKNKNIVVIGSGATAFSVVPALAKDSNVTMIQRSPTYMRTEASEPHWLSEIKQTSSDLMEIHTRARDYSKNFQYESVNRCINRPDAMKRILIKDVEKKLKPEISIKHFTPNYTPWEQRLCTLVDDDFIKSINDGVSIETDSIERFTKNSVVLSSGKEIPADIIVYATGFETEMNGSMKIIVNGLEKKFGDQLVYKGVMVEDLPNFGFIFGYTKMSWTLKLELALEYYIRVLRYMGDNEYKVCVPVNDSVTEKLSGFLDLQTNFYLRNENMFPRVSKTMPWTNINDIVKDKSVLTTEDINDGVLRFYASLDKIRTQ